jgi:BAI1-associated protein 3
LENSRAFRRCCPFHKEIRGEVVAALRKGVVEWYTFEQDRCIHNEAVTLNHVSGLIVLTNRLYADLMRTLQIYDDMFQK